MNLDEPSTPLRIALVRTYTTDLLRPYWRLEGLLHGFDVDLYEAPYGATSEESGAGLASAQADIVFFFLRLEDLDPRFGRPIASMALQDRQDLIDDIVANVDRMVASCRRVTSAMVVVTLLPPLHESELGMFDEASSDGSARCRNHLKEALAGSLRERHTSAFFADLDALVTAVGRADVFDPRLWWTSRYPWSTRGAQALVRRLFRYAFILKRGSAKVIVLDADNTLWGGILGEDGTAGIALGPEYPGCAFVAFQRRLLDFHQRGLLLALCSKNNYDEVADVLANHPYQLLREHHFAAVRVNWEPKVDNIRLLADELNLGLDSFVYVDDSPHECLQVREQLPQVTVVTTPEQTASMPWTLDDVVSLEILSLTQEDRERSAMYVRDRHRRQLSAKAIDHGQYLESLKMFMTVSIDDRHHIGRVAQLTQKTNQFNVTTRRYLESDIERMMVEADWMVADFSLSDVFGASGIVGVVLVKGLTGGVAEIDTFLMSCRVIGRGAESVFLDTVLSICRDAGVREVRATYVPTPKNGLVADFWPRHGFRQSNGSFSAVLDQWPRCPAGHITVDIAQPREGQSTI